MDTHGYLIEEQHTNRRGSLLGRLLLILFGIAFSIVLLEGLARIYLALSPNMTPRTHYSFRKTQPPPYKDASYFSSAFIDEQFARNDWSTPPGTILILPTDFDGQFYHSHDGKRRTAFQPAQYQNTVYIFGGSTIFNGEVPDEYTIASRLQLLLNAKFGERYRVENLGAATVAIAQQLARLKTITLKQGDIVIFYDGVNDINQSIYYKDPSGWMIQHNRSVLNNLQFIQRWRIKIFEQLADRSRFVYLFLYPYDINAMPPQLEDASQPILQGLLEQMHTNYRAYITEANQYARNGGATFYHFLQPNLFTLPTLSAYEEGLLQNRYLIPRGIDIAFARGYPILRQASSEVRDLGVQSADLSDIYTDRLAGEEFYLDYCHVTDRAHQIMAETFFRRVFEPSLK
jgi:hypothetical protein